MKAFDGSQAVVVIPAEAKALPGETFAGEIAGPRATARFKATLKSISAVITAAEGTEADGAPTTELEFKLDDQPQYFNKGEASRKRLDDIPVVVHVSGRQIGGKVVDGSSGGVGLVVEDDPGTGAEVVLVLDAQRADLSMKAKVRYSRTLRGGGFRCGLEIVEMGRLDQPKWRNLLEAA